MDLSVAPRLVQIGLLGEAVEGAPVAVLVADENGRYVAANTYACNLFGYGEIGEEGSTSYRRSSGALLSIFNDRLKMKERFVGVRIDTKEDVYPALKHFFGRRGIETPA